MSFGNTLCDDPLRWVIIDNHGITPKTRSSPGRNSENRTTNLLSVPWVHPHSSRVRQMNTCRTIRARTVAESTQLICALSFVPPTSKTTSNARLWQIFPVVVELDVYGAVDRSAVRWHNVWNLSFGTERFLQVPGTRHATCFYVLPLGVK